MTELFIRSFLYNLEKEAAKEQLILPGLEKLIKRPESKKNLMKHIKAYFKFHKPEMKVQFARSLSFGIPTGITVGIVNRLLNIRHDPNQRNPYVRELTSKGMSDSNIALLS